MTYEIKVYKIWYEDCPEEFYIGSTKETLARRMCKHRIKVWEGNTSRIYSLIREKGPNDFKYVQVASCMVENIDEQRQFEQEWINELTPTLNTRRAFSTEEDFKATQKIYRAKPEIKAKLKAYKARPEVKAKEKIYQAKPELRAKRAEYKKSVRQVCICGNKYLTTPSGTQKHYSTQHHRQHVERIFHKLSTVVRPQLD